MIESCPTRANISQVAHSPQLVQIPNPPLEREIQNKLVAHLVELEDKVRDDLNEIDRKLEDIHKKDKTRKKIRS